MTLVNQPESEHAAAVLLACARSSLAAEHADCIESVHGRGLDWDDVWARACKHGISYFVARHLQGLCEREPARFALPNEVAEHWREEQRCFALQALRFLHYQLELSERFESQSIPYLWLKGLGLSQQLYNRIDARCSSDLDLLVHPDQRTSVAACLRQCGFEIFHSPVPGKDEHFMGAHHETWVTHKDGHTTVEVHFRLSGPAACQPKVEDLLSRARHLEISGQRMRVPACEDELLILCLHAHQHNYALLRTLMDIAEYVRVFREELDWTTFFGRAQACRTAGRVHAGLYVSHRTLGQAELPGLELTTTQLGVLRGLAPESIAGSTSDQNDLLRVRLALLMDRWLDVGRVLLPHVLPPTAYVRAVYPGQMGWVPGVARLYHLARLAWRALGG
jgi:hypothetical protein